jgi:hypothetical protein
MSSSSSSADSPAGAPSRVALFPSDAAQDAFVLVTPPGSAPGSVPGSPGAGGAPEGTTSQPRAAWRLSGVRAPPKHPGLLGVRVSLSYLLPPLCVCAPSRVRILG